MSNTGDVDEKTIDDFVTLFENSNRIFADVNTLSKNYTPKRIIARDEQILDIATNLKPIMNLSSPVNMYIWGGKGVGKSISINHVLNILSTGLKIRNKNIIIDFFNINCAILTTDTAVCRTILSRYSSEFQSNITKDIPKRGIPIDYYKSKIWDFINERASQSEIYAFILFFDEIDKWNLNKKRSTNEEFAQISLLYDFTRPFENHRINPENVDKCFISIIAASNKMDFLTTIEGSIRSSAGFEYINFPDYKEEDLFKILSDRKDAFRPGAITDELIRYVAREVAVKYNGDARRALDILYSAGRKAEKNKQDMVTLENILEADTKIAVSATTDMLMDFSVHDKYLLIAIYLCQKYKIEATTGLVYKIFCEICRISGEKATSFGHNSRRLSELKEKSVIITQKGIKGNTRLSQLSETVIDNIIFIYPDELKIKIQNDACDFEAILNDNNRQKKVKTVTLNEYT